MISFLFLSSLSNSISSSPTIFVGNWYYGLNSNEKSVFSVQFKYYFQFQNDENESILMPVNEQNMNDINLSSRDCFLFAVGKLRLKQSKNIGFTQPDQIIAGIYRKDTSEFYMVYFLENYLPESIIKQIENFDNPQLFKNETELSSFLFKMKSISHGFNISKQESMITKTDIQAFKLKNVNNVTIKNKEENYTYFKRQIILEQLKIFSIQQFGNNIFTNDTFFPFIYIKMNDNSKMRKKSEICNSFEGFLICSVNNESNLSNFIELKASEVDEFSFRRNLRNFAIITFFTSITICILTNKINVERQYQAQFRYFCFFGFDLLYCNILDLFADEISIFTNSFSSVLYLICIGRKYMSIENFKKPLDTFNISFAYLKQFFFVLIQFVLFLIPLAKVNEKLDSSSNIMILYLSICLIPQIIFNYFIPLRNIKNTIYMFLVMYIRFYEISYYFLHFQNKSISLIIFAFILIFFQSLIFIIQSLLHSVLYVKKREKTIGFRNCNKTIETPTDCPICLCEINPHSYDYMITPCNHVFHVDCLTRWMNVNMTCPMCRSNLPPIEVYSSFFFKG